MKRGDVWPALIVLVVAGFFIGLLIRISPVEYGEDSSLLTNDQLFGVDSSSGLYWPIPRALLDIPVGADTPVVVREIDSLTVVSLPHQPRSVK